MSGVSKYPVELRARARDLYATLKLVDRVADQLAVEGTPVPRGTLYTWLYDITPTREKDRGPAVDVPKEAREATTETRTGHDQWAVDSQSKRIKTVEDLIAHLKVDQDTWEIVSSTAGSYEVTYVPRAVREHDRDGWTRKSGQAVTVTMYRVSVKLRKRTEQLLARRAVAQMVETALAGVTINRGPYVERRPPESGNLLELAIYDHHFNKLVWGKETGGADYDLKIAVAVYRRALEELIARSAHHRYEKVLMPIGHDIFNADNREGTTTHGTRQDNDTRLLKVVDAVLGELVWSAGYVVERLGCPIEYVLVPGNHDELLSALLVKMLKCWFRSDPNVAVDDGPTLTKYRQWGRVLLGFNHGDKAKPDVLAQQMATDPEAVAMWASTTYREMHVGHKHTEWANEYGGVKVRGLPSLTAADYWHAGQGYRNNLRQAQAFHWNKSDGLVSTAVYTHPAA